MRALTAALALALSAAVAHAEEPRWKAELRRNLVESRGEKLVIDEYSLCTVAAQAGGRGERIQARSYAEAPAALVSRDTLVRHLATIEAGVVAEYQRQGKDLSCKVIEEPIGELDLEVRLIMTADGFQSEIANRRDGKTVRTTRSWDEVYPGG